MIDWLIAGQQEQWVPDDQGPSVQSAIGEALEEQNTLLRQIVEEKEYEITDLVKELDQLKTKETGMNYC